MTNPYKGPDSNVDVEVQTTVPKTAWKVFFWILLLLETLSLISMFYDSEEELLINILELVIYSFILIGIYGFVYNKRILYRKLWAIFIPVGIIYDLYTVTTIELTTVDTMMELYIVFGIIIIIFLPMSFFQYMALYKYSFKSVNIWS